MAYKKDGDFKFSKRGIDRIIEEKNSTFLALRQIAWNVTDEDEVDETKIKLDLRKYMIDKDGNEVMGKGVSFLTLEGPNELVKIMLEEGYGDTTECLDVIRKRNDFIEAITFITDGKPEEETAKLFDLRDIV